MNGRYSLNLPFDLKIEAEAFAKKQGISLNQFILWSLAEKLGQLKESMTNANYPSIFFKLNSTGVPIPCIGNGMRVQTIVIAYHIWKESTQAISDDYDIPEKIVKEALKYYEDNKLFIDGLIDENEKSIAEISQKPPSDTELGNRALGNAV